MKALYKRLKYLPVLVLALLLSSCEGNRTAQETEEVTVDTATQDDNIIRVEETGRTAEERLESFRSWLNNKADRTDTAIREEWPEIREEFRRRNAELESNVDSLSAKSKEEYKQLKQRYARWEERQERRQNTPLDQQKLEQWQEQLLREFDDLNSITSQNVREAYLTFMGTVRAKRSNWNQDDWDYVDHVYSQLNDRRRQIENNISTGDKLKIRALQTEYLALEGSADVGSAVRGVQN
ncbi:hypothetical protein [Pontibacter harenae]|uniref:hypothetical protein n=1 Tax=Pontibacter harenae TaxID=2894083 RepID=UPI001E3C230F|nr:hypothetical protein [Pontibacter harenae]MCC9166797.1 hypothetical protein [Pontibacter harenae]